MEMLLNDSATTIKGEVLSRNEMRMIKGGVVEPPSSYGCKTSACTWTDGNGYTTTGTCGGKGEATGGPYGTITMECFCNTSNHTSPTPVGSNGGVSRCYND
ncbi:hypothetical protein [Pedobacter rhodius]|uniref:Natural product n=1 Tax=Pedobacter rhodius TaxID=3004098 RepID=A0ABT4KUI5_9SPHI|nr:hypothetical protein [Pedobacter sp. SJ11]MCZ4222594.1 hypothetical protein [Pedobacter sp. SJ11]